jgi:hypothetical protein
MLVTVVRIGDAEIAPPIFVGGHAAVCKAAPAWQFARVVPHWRCVDPPYPNRESFRRASPGGGLARARHRNDVFHGGADIGGRR